MRTNVDRQDFKGVVYLAAIIVIWILLAHVLTGCRGPEGRPGASIKGDKGDVGAPGPTIVGPQGPQGPQGVAGNDGLNGVNGSNGLDGTQITVVPLCPGVSSYPGVFIEIGLCIEGKLYGIYSTHGGFMTYLPNGSYSSNAVGSACNLTISGCTVSH